jgi:PA26 p53-induced protein (sestrin)
MENVSSAVSDSQRYYAVWQYVHCLLGICYEDYKYSQLEALLSSDLRSYIKLATYHPERLYEDRFKHIVQSIGDVEMVR